MLSHKLAAPLVKSRELVQVPLEEINQYINVGISFFLLISGIAVKAIAMLAIQSVIEIAPELSPVGVSNL